MKNNTRTFVEYSPMKAEKKIICFDSVKNKNAFLKDRSQYNDKFRSITLKELKKKYKFYYNVVAFNSAFNNVSIDWDTRVEV